jgi:DNA-binding beta-propeller fold protein YncE
MFSPSAAHGPRPDATPQEPHMNAVVHRSLTLPLALALAVSGAAGCAGAPPAQAGGWVWPDPPMPARVKWVRTLRSPSDLAPRSLWERIRRVFLGTDESLGTFNPTALALNADGTRLYVTLTSTARVLEIDFTEGAFRQVATEEGRRPGQPFALAVDPAGNLYVSDLGLHTVWVYAPTGGYLREIGRKILERPVGLAIDARRGLLYVSDGGRPDDQHHQVEVFTLDGQHLRTIGKRGTGPGEFNFPGYLAVGPDGTLYVSDTLNFRIQMFDPEGTLLGFFGKNGDGVGGFNKAKGLAIDGAGLLHVADAGNSFVQIWNQRQQLLLAYGGPGARTELMGAPNGVAIDAKNNIYVADMMYNRVNQYVLVDATKPEGDPLPKPAETGTTGPAASAAPPAAAVLPPPPPPPAAAPPKR